MKNMLFVQNPSEYRLLDSYIGYIPEVSNREDCKQSVNPVS